GRAVAGAAVLQPAGARLRPLPDADPRSLVGRLVNPPGGRGHGCERTDRRDGGAPGAGSQGRLMATNGMARGAASGFDAIIVGGGHNALVTPRYPPKAGP